MVTSHTIPAGVGGQNQTNLQSETAQIQEEKKAQPTTNQIKSTDTKQDKSNTAGAQTETKSDKNKKPAGNDNK